LNYLFERRELLLWSVSMEEAEPSSLHIMAKPTGSICNLDCEYCFFLSKERLYPDSDFRMTSEVMREYIAQYVNAVPAGDVMIAWQGGEPMMMGLDFFAESVECARAYATPEKNIAFSIQTNGTLIDEKFCDFFRGNSFLVGLSLDGPRELHDAYRHDKSGGETFDRVVRAARMMQRRDVDFNILCSVHAANQGHPLDVYRFFRDELGVKWIQFVPIVERINADGTTLLQEGDSVTDRSVDPAAWGDFLNGVFDEWLVSDVGDVHVNFFEAAFASWAGAPALACIFAETCGGALVLEHNGDLYSCDHFVEPRHLLGNIMSAPLAELVRSEKQRDFGEAKRSALPRLCTECELLFACGGECPKNRFLLTDADDPGLNYLCAGYKAFFEHVDTPMRAMARLYRYGRNPSEIMEILAEKQAAMRSAFTKAGRNDPCPCGSRMKFKQCHGKT